MGFFEKSFAWTYSKLDSFFSKEDPPGSVYLSQVSQEYEYLGRIILNTPIEIHETQEIGGFVNTFLFLPSKLSIFDSIEKNAEGYRYRVLVSLASFKYYPLADWEILLSNFVSEYPGFQELRSKISNWLNVVPKKEQAVANMLLHGNFPKNDPEHLLLLKHLKSNLPNQKIKTEIKVKNTIRKKTTQPSKDQENPLSHFFEKIKTLDSYTGGNQKQDSADELKSHENALKQVKLSETILSNDQAENLYQPDAILSTPTEKDSTETTQNKTFCYPEWSWKKQTYQNNWCTIIEQEIKQSNVLDGPKNTNLLKSKLSRLVRDPVWIKNRTNGSEIDIDAVISNYVDFYYKKSSPTERLYEQKVAKTRSLATLILIDSSLSTDSYINDKRVIDKVQDAVITLTTALKDFSLLLGVASFFSESRSSCYFQWLKRFDEPHAVIFTRLNLVPRGYTRMGAAIRHANWTLTNQKSRHKALILLSDSKPTDYDTYEGKYGVEDVHHSILEGESRGIRTQAFCFNKDKTHHLDKMYGRGRYDKFKEDNKFVESVYTFYRKLLKNS